LLTKNILSEIAFAQISLKADYLRADYPFSENLELSAIMFLIFTLFIVTHASIVISGTPHFFTKMFKIFPERSATIQF